MCSFNLQWKYRSLIFKHSLYALYDLVILPFLLCIILTVWRLRSLSRVLRLNGHFLKYLPEPPILELSSLDRIKMINAGKKTYMSVHSCITITFLALLLDIPMIPLAIFCAIVAPWRISEIWKIVLAKDERVPTKFKIKALFRGKRMNLILLLLQILFLDVPTILFTICLLLTVVRYLETFMVVRKHLRAARTQLILPVIYIYIYIF